MVNSFFAALVVLVLAGCSSAPQVASMTGACDTGEASYTCQVARYHRASGP